MDLLNYSSKYQKYLDRINEYKEITDKNQAFSSIHSRIDTLSNDLKSKNDKNYYNYIHLGIVALSVLLAVVCLFDRFYFLGMVLVSVAVGARYFFTSTMKNLIISVDKEHDEELKEQSFEQQLFHKMQYLKKGIELKTTRINIVKHSFMVIFPLALLGSISIFGLQETGSWFVQSLFAIVMGCMFWFYFFKDDLDELEYQGMELQQYIEDFLRTENIKEIQVSEAGIISLDDIGENSNSEEFPIGSNSNKIGFQGEFPFSTFDEDVKL